jgi:hypothetical protein
MWSKVLINFEVDVVDSDSGSEAGARGASFETKKKVRRVNRSGPRSFSPPARPAGQIYVSPRDEAVKNLVKANDDAAAMMKRDSE